MSSKEIELDKLVTRGKGQTQMEDKTLAFWTDASPASVDFNLVGNCYKRHAIMLPEKCKLPFRLDLQVKLDYPALILLVGNGHVVFYQDGSHKIEDIVKQDGKPNLDGGQFNNKVPFGEYVKISVIYDYKQMQILVKDEERFYSTKMPYMKAKDLKTRSEEGFEVGMVVNKRSRLSIKEIQITEYEDCANIQHEERDISNQDTKNMNSGVKEQALLTFEDAVASLPQSCQEDMLQMDEFLKNLSPMKFKRSLDKKAGKISYLASEYGISYIVRLGEDRMRQSFSWYVVTAGKADTWHRIADYMEDALKETAKRDLPLAERIFYAMNDCVGCYGANCRVKTLYEFNGKKRLCCHGCVILHISKEDFKDVRDFLSIVNDLMIQKTAEGTLQTEKIYL